MTIENNIWFKQKSQTLQKYLIFNINNVLGLMLIEQVFYNIYYVHILYILNIKEASVRLSVDLQCK